MNVNRFRYANEGSFGRRPPAGQWASRLNSVRHVGYDRMVGVRGTGKCRTAPAAPSGIVDPGMRVVIVGAGAMGCLFGAHLSAVADVALIDPWKEHVDALVRGLAITGLDGATRVIPLRAGRDAASVPGGADLALVFVKARQTAWAAGQASAVLKDSGLALTLQNGVGNLEVVAEAVGPARAVQGVTAHGATLLGPGRVRHAGTGPTHLATRADIHARVSEIARVFAAAGFQTHVADDVESLVWGKLIANVGVNALTALLRVPNGIVADVPEARAMLVAAVEEAVAVARAKGIRLAQVSPVEHVLGVARATGPNRSSMFQDVLRGAPTEVDVINGAIVRDGERLGIPTPVNRVLVGLVRALEATAAARAQALTDPIVSPATKESRNHE
jgi:2-dehydropantoate 2-reductase